MVWMSDRPAEEFSPHPEPAHVTGHDLVDESGFAEPTPPEPR
jgi:hypothetical protein